MAKKSAIQVRKAQAPTNVELLIEPGDIVTLPQLAAEHVRFRQACREVMTRTAQELVETVRQCRADVKAGADTIAAV